MTGELDKIGFGGGCHWCTEAIFQSLKGVDTVEQGWIASDGINTSFSKAVIINFKPQIISLKTLIDIHLHTHSSTAEHSLRSKYRSAVYTLNAVQANEAVEAMAALRHTFNKPVITRVIPFVAFKLNSQNFLNYYYSDINKPFCKNIIGPKLKLLMQHFAKNVDTEKSGLS